MHTPLNTRLFFPDQTFDTFFPSPSTLLSHCDEHLQQQRKKPLQLILPAIDVLTVVLSFAIDLIILIPLLFPFIDFQYHQERTLHGITQILSCRVFEGIIMIY
jgi:hypothetical protein